MFAVANAEGGGDAKVGGWNVTTEIRSRDNGQVDCSVCFGSRSTKCDTGAELQLMGAGWIPLGKATGLMLMVRACLVLALDNGRLNVGRCLHQFHIESNVQPLRSKFGRHESDFTFHNAFTTSSSYLQITRPELHALMMWLGLCRRVRIAESLWIFSTSMYRRARDGVLVAKLWDIGTGARSCHVYFTRAE